MAVYNAGDGCKFEGRQILFDTNVYIFIDGFDARPKLKIYSDYYWKTVKEKKNKIIINDYILGEFFNRCCKDKHGLDSQEETQPLTYKNRRETPEFIDFMESIRDSCFHFLKDATFVAACNTQTNIEEVLQSAAKGRLDFSDVILSNHCSSDKIILVTDDYDYIDSTFDIVTANQRLLTDAAARGILKA